MYGCTGGSFDLLRKNEKVQLLTAKKEIRVIKTNIYKKSVCGPKIM